MKNFWFPSEITKENIDWFYLGIRQGVWAKSWMKNGVSYSGTSGATLKDTYQDIYNEYLEKCNQLGHEPLTL